MANTIMRRVDTIITMISVSVIWVSMPIVPVVIGTGISFGLTFFASPITIRMGIGIRGNMGNNWGDGMGDFSSLVFDTSHGSSSVHRNGERGNMRYNEAMAIGKRDTIDSVGISLTLFASPISISIRMGIMGNNWSDGMSDLSGCVFDSSHGGGPGYRYSKRGNMMCNGYMRKTVMIEKLGISLGFTFFASNNMGGSRQGLQVPSGAFFFD